MHTYIRLSAHESSQSKIRICRTRRHARDNPVRAQTCTATAWRTALHCINARRRSFKCCNNFTNIPTSQHQTGEFFSSHSFCMRTSTSSRRRDISQRGTGPPHVVLMPVHVELLVATRPTIIVAEGADREHAPDPGRLHVLEVSQDRVR